MAWAHRYKPPSGIPSKPASTGTGWGGPAMGAGSGSRVGPRTQERMAVVRAVWTEMQRDPEKMEERKQFKREKEARIEQLIENLGDLALNAPEDNAKISASIAALNRLDGMPKAKIENVNIATSFKEMVKRSLLPRDE